MPPTLKVRMVKGPARVFVKGACHVLGSDVSGQIVKVRSGKALPFEPRNQWCRLQAQLGYGARLWWADPKQAGISMWRTLSEQVLALAANKKAITTVMLVGDTDTGKSTLSIYLANMAIRNGLIPSIIDGDIGQGDLAPPTAIGAAVLSKQLVDLRDANASQFEFIGGVSPIGFESLIAKKLRSILDRIRTNSLANICIVNTDGYVRNSGLQYKAMIAEELQPDAVICLGENVELFDRQRQHKAAVSYQILCARRSSQVYKSRFERLNRRLDQFLRFVGHGSSIAKLSNIKFDYMNELFSPTDLLNQPPSNRRLEADSMRGMFVGLGSNGSVIGFGVIINVNLENNIIHTQTNINSFDTTYLSNLRLGGEDDRIMEIRLI
jgi:polynucleotide 5'-hydroxyl-kinase GRC3/NOL9